MFNKRMLRLVSSATKDVAVSVAAGLVSALFGAVLLLECASALACAAAGDSWTRPFAIALGCLFGAFAARAASAFAARRAGSRATATITREIFSKLVRCGQGVAAYVALSEVVQLMGEGTERLRPYFERYLPQFFLALLSPLVTFALLARIDWVSALVMLVCVPLMPGVIMMFMKRAKGALGEYWGTYVDLGAEFLDAIRGLVTLKAYGADGMWHKRLNERAEGFRQITMRLLRVQLGNVIVMDAVTFGGIALGVIVACARLAAGALSFADALAIALLAPNFFMPMRSFGSLFHTGMNANAVIERIFTVLDIPEPARGTQGVLSDRPAIEVEDVSFGYPTGTQALSHVSLALAAGTLVGLTGASGSGKSTLARLMCGQLTDYEGSIRVCGCELRDVDPAVLRGLVTYVGAHEHVFKGSFRSNLQMAKPEATENELWGALRQAALDEYVLSCGGLDARVTEDGGNLSGGQRQRLCFARAILRDTPIYIFDEVASNIDVVSETKITDGIQQLSVHKTILFVSHRLSPLAWSDEIYVMEGGSVAEHGPHQVLVRHDGPYRRLWAELSELESYAARSGVEYDTETYVPTEAELAAARALASRPDLPVMGAQAMAAALEVLSYRRYFSEGGDEAPAGHPAWIPLPTYRRGISKELAEDAAGQGLQVDETDSGAEMAQKDAEAQRRVAVDSARRRGSWTVVRDLLRVTSGANSQFARASILAAAGNLLAAAVPALGVAAFAAVSAGSSAALIIAALVVVAAIRALVHYRERLLTHDQTFRTIAAVRSRIFGKLRELAPARLQARDAGDLISLVTSDTELLEGVYSRCLAPILGALVAAFAAVVFVFVSAGWWAAVACAVSYLVIGAVFPVTTQRLTRERSQELRSFAVLMYSFLLDSVRGLSELIQFGRAQEYERELGAHLDALSDGEDLEAHGNACIKAATSALSLLSITCLAAVLAPAVGCGALDLAMAAVVLCVHREVLRPLEAVSELGFSLGQTIAAARRILEVLDERPAILEDAASAESSVSAAPFDLGPVQALDIDFDHVAFAYETGRPVLEDVSLHVPAGQIVRIVGRSGAGKSTMLQLAMRFWDAGSGSVSIGGADVRGLAPARVRELQSYMTQDTYLFDTTLRENLLLARPSATSEQLQRAIDNASLQEVIDRLPQGLDTPVGEGGSSLSDGERQRVGLARALLHDAPILLLDEPTSNLDALNEAAVLRAIATGAAGKTVLIASHRRATAAIATSTFVLERAQIS